MKNYHFTQSWFTSNDLEQILPVNTKEEIHILEIGCFEGQSSVWFIENLLENPKSSITCIDPFISYNQKHNSLNSYDEKMTENNFEEISEGYVFTNEYDTFKNNIKETNKSKQVTIIKNFSEDTLPTLITTNKKYDIIFIDGNHTAPYVLSDAIMSWKLLKVNGIMVFDDYLWYLDKPEVLRPKMAIDAFISNYADYLQVCWSDYRLAIKRIQ